MISTTILVNLFSQTMKQAIFYMFNLLQKSESKDDKTMKFIDSELGDDPQIQDNDSMSDSETSLRQYSLRERKPVNYKV